MALELWTYQDTVEHLLDVFDLDRTNRNLRLARSSILNTYRDMPNRCRWAYYDRQYILKTVASQTTGTIEFDYTGGSSELLVTLTGATWPSWAEYGRLIINDVHYEIDKRLSSTTLTLKTDSNPGADVAALTTYTIYRNAYPLPNDFRRVNQVWDRTSVREIPILLGDAINLDLQWIYSTPGIPMRATIRNTGEFQSNLSLQFSPPTSTARSYDISYQAKGRDLVTEKYSTGTVSMSAAGTTVTGVSTVFATKHVGCVIRFSADGTTEPSSRIGNRTSNVDNPATFETIIKSFTSTTSVTTVDAAPAALSGVKYTISDPVDIEPNAMFTAFQKLAEAEFARQVKREDSDKWMAEAMRGLRLAMESDDRADGTQGGTYTWYRHGEITTT